MLPAQSVSTFISGSDTGVRQAQSTPLAPAAARLESVSGTACRYNLRGRRVVDFGEALGRHAPSVWVVPADARGRVQVR